MVFGIVTRVKSYTHMARQERTCPGYMPVILCSNPTVVFQRAASSRELLLCICTEHAFWDFWLLVHHIRMLQCCILCTKLELLPYNSFLRSSLLPLTQVSAGADRA